MITKRFRATPLTPIHVGNGDVLAPEDYLILGDELVRFNRAAVLKDMSAEVRRSLENLLDKNDFSGAQALIRSAVDANRHTLCRSQIGAESREALQDMVKKPDTAIRSREVHPFVFNPISSRPYLPGSAIKGAIRTALVNHFTQKNLKEIAQSVAREHRQKWRELETNALDFSFRHMEEDPLRLFKLADAELPAGSTRIDRVLIQKRGGDAQEGKIQMHYERLLCRADDMDISFTVELQLDELAMHHPAVQVGQKLNFELIRTACNLFYHQRMQAEQARFFSEDDIPERRYGVSNLMKFQNGKLLFAKSIQQRGLLLRVGRFSHFESLSVDELRVGWNMQKKREITEGSSRTLCRCRSDQAGASQLSPFGWLLLRPEE